MPFREEAGIWMQAAADFFCGGSAPVPNEGDTAGAGIDHVARYPGRRTMTTLGGTGGAETPRQEASTSLFPPDCSLIRT
jgi:hypothetical protein